MFLGFTKIGLEHGKNNDHQPAIFLIIYQLIYIDINLKFGTYKLIQSLFWAFIKSNSQVWVNAVSRAGGYRLFKAQIDLETK